MWCISLINSAKQIKVIILIKPVAAERRRSRLDRRALPLLTTFYQGSGVKPSSASPSPLHHRLAPHPRPIYLLPLGSSLTRRGQESPARMKGTGAALSKSPAEGQRPGLWSHAKYQRGFTAQLVSDQRLEARRPGNGRDLLSQPILSGIFNPPCCSFVASVEGLLNPKEPTENVWKREARPKNLPGDWTNLLCVTFKAGK